MSTIEGWIKVALTAGPGRKLIVAQDERWGYMAILDFGVLDLRIGGNGRTPEEALAALEENLVEDAADEMMKAGVV